MTECTLCHRRVQCHVYPGALGTFKDMPVCGICTEVYDTIDRHARLIAQRIACGSLPRSVAREAAITYHEPEFILALKYIDHWDHCSITDDVNPTHVCRGKRSTL